MRLSCYVPSQIIPKSRVVHLADKQILKRHILSYPKIICLQKSPRGEGFNTWPMDYQLALKRHHTNTTTKTRVASGNPHLACKEISNTHTQNKFKKWQQQWALLLAQCHHHAPSVNFIYINSIRGTHKLHQRMYI